MNMCWAARGCCGFLVQRSKGQRGPARLWSRCCRFHRAATDPSFAASWSALPRGVELGLPKPPSLPLEWSQAVEQVHPLARPLMTTTTSDGNVWPTLLLLPTGKGRVGWLGSDDLWRWRRTSQPAQGDAVVMSIIRLLARHVAPLEPLLRVVPDPIEGQSVSIVLEGDLPDDPTEIEVDINDASGAPLQRVVLHRHGSQWRGLWRPARAGMRNLEAQGVHLSVDVAPRTSEDMRLGVDIDNLTALIAETGGALMDPEDLTDLFEQVPHRARRTSRLIDEGPAGAWLLWSLLGAFLTLEWGLRRWECSGMTQQRDNWPVQQNSELGAIDAAVITLRRRHLTRVVLRALTMLAVFAVRCLAARCGDTAACHSSSTRPVRRASCEHRCVGRAVQAAWPP